MSYSFRHAVVFISGSDGSLGAEFISQSLQRGADKVYASEPTPRTWDDSRIVGVMLDVTNPASIAQAAGLASDTTVLINNIGAPRGGGSLLTGSLADIRDTFETNFFGPLSVTRGFAPVLGANGGGAVLDVHSGSGWIARTDSDSAAAAALQSATDSSRVELAAQGTHVLGLHLGATSTPMTLVYDERMTAAVARIALDGLEAGEYGRVAENLAGSNDIDPPLVDAP